ncbi:MAG: hypothetical protein AAF802_26230 [Planctomycetota bacterium]
MGNARRSTLVGYTPHRWGEQQMASARKHVNGRHLARKTEEHIVDLKEEHIVDLKQVGLSDP